MELTLLPSLLSKTLQIPVLCSVPDDECKLLVKMVLYNTHEGPWPSGDEAGE